MRASLLLLALPIVLIAMVAPKQTQHQPLDPDEPIAADGSLTPAARSPSSISSRCSARSIPHIRRRIPTNQRISTSESRSRRPGPTAAGRNFKAARPARRLDMRGRQSPSPDCGRAHVLRRSRPAEIQLLAARPARQGRHRARMVDSARPAHRRFRAAKRCSPGFCTSRMCRSAPSPNFRRACRPPGNRRRLSAAEDRAQVAGALTTGRPHTSRPVRGRAAAARATVSPPWC